MTIPVLTRDELVDVPTRWETDSRTELASNHIVSFVRDEVRTPDGTSMTRDWLRHLGAVGIIAVDQDDCVVLVRQYRHPVGFRLVEPPAGLLDIPGEDWLDAAQRELAEEAHVSASQWSVLVDVMTSPGGLGETARIYLATDLSPAPAPEGFVAEGEEAHMDVVRAPVADVAAAILAGRLQSPLLVAGVLALTTARATGASLRPAHADWPARRQFQPW